MNVYYGLSQFASKKPTALAIGIFDGVHRGHQYLISTMVSLAKRQRLKPVVVTFYPHPAHVMHPGISLAYITTLQERLRLIEQIGVKDVVVLKFSKSLAQLSPQSFVGDILVKQLKAQAVVVGEDFRFGHQREGDIFTLQQLAKDFKITCVAVKPLLNQRLAISSTRIRGLVTEGNLADAARLLGRHFSVSGQVVKGDGRGKLLGFPTANIRYQAGVLPPKGVYAIKVKLNKNIYPAVANLGVRPTFKNSQESLLLEVHLLIQRRINLYGKYLEVMFVKFLRDERSFPHQQALIKQIHADVRRARQILS